jgi:hypothetical protein
MSTIMLFISLQILETSPYREGATEFFTDSAMLFFVDRRLSDSTATTAGSLTPPRPQIYLFLVLLVDYVPMLDGVSY